MTKTTVKLGRRTSKKTAANRLLKKIPVNSEHKSALKILTRAVKHYDKTMQSLARAEAKLSVAQQKLKAVAVYDNKKEKIRLARQDLRQALRLSESARIASSAAESALDRITKLVHSLEKKEMAKRKALLDFIRQWERSYNLEHGIESARSLFKQTVSEVLRKST